MCTVARREVSHVPRTSTEPCSVLLKDVPLKSRMSAHTQAELNGYLKHSGQSTETEGLSVSMQNGHGMANGHSKGTGPRQVPSGTKLFKVKLAFCPMYPPFTQGRG